VQEGQEPPGIIRNKADGFYSDFLCTSGYIEDDEDGPSFARRFLASRTAAE